MYLKIGYLGIKVKEVAALWSIILLAVSIVCLLTAFRDPNDLGLTGTLVAVALSVVVNIHGNQKNDKYLLVWHIQASSVGVLHFWWKGGTSSPYGLFD